MNVQEIILEKMKAVGADGLYNSDGECGCGDDDLFPCCNSMDGFLDCQLAKNVFIKDHCNWFKDWFNQIRTKKPRDERRTP